MGGGGYQYDGGGGGYQYSGGTNTMGGRGTNTMGGGVLNIMGGGGWRGNYNVGHRTGSYRFSK